MAAGTLLASEVRKATTQSERITMPTGVPQRGVLLALDVTATPNNTETLTVAIQAYDLVSKKYVSLTTFAATKKAEELGANPTTATLLYTLYPGAAETAATANHEVQALPVPPYWRAVVTHSGEGNWTYTLTYQPLQ